MVDNSSPSSSRTRKLRACSACRSSARATGCPSPGPASACAASPWAVRAGRDRAQARVTAEDGERICTVIGVPGSGGRARDPRRGRRDGGRAARARRAGVRGQRLARAATPLTTILGAIEALQSGAKEEPVQRDRFLVLLEREAGRLARLARALLVLARAQTRAELPQRDRSRCSRCSRRSRAASWPGPASASRWSASPAWPRSVTATSPSRRCATSPRTRERIPSTGGSS